MEAWSFAVINRSTCDLAAGRKAKVSEEKRTSCRAVAVDLRVGMWTRVSIRHQGHVEVNGKAI